MLAKMRAPQDGGSRLAIVFNGSPLFTGDAGGGESEIRRWVIENDWLEAIVALPEQLFYNTGISTYLWVLTNRKEKPRKGKVQLIDARPFWVQMEKSLGNKRRRIGDPDDKEKDPDHIGDLTKIHGAFRDGETRVFTEEDPITKQPVRRERVISKIFDNEDFGYHKITVERPLRLNFQASSERIARLEEESAFRNLAVSKKNSHRVDPVAESTLDPMVFGMDVEGGAATHRDGTRTGRYSQRESPRHRKTHHVENRYPRLDGQDVACLGEAQHAVHPFEGEDVTRRVEGSVAITLSCPAWDQCSQRLSAGNFLEIRQSLWPSHPLNPSPIPPESLQPHRGKTCGGLIAG